MRSRSAFTRCSIPRPAAGQAAAPARLTQEQLAHVHELALRRPWALDLPEAKAGLLADAMVGSLAGA